MCTLNISVILLRISEHELKAMRSRDKSQNDMEDLMLSSKMYLCSIWIKKIGFGLMTEVVSRAQFLSLFFPSTDQGLAKNFLSIITNLSWF